MPCDSFPEITVAEDVAYDHIAEALTAFQTTAFRSDASPFDTVLRTGDSSLLSADAQAGLALVYGEAGCSSCHSRPLLTDHQFHAIAVPQFGPGKGHGGDMTYLAATGLPGRAEDEGRYRITGDPADIFAFRTPSLRNVALTGSWGHSGAFSTLEEVVRHHLDPEASLASFVADDLTLPPLAILQRLVERGSELRFAPLETDRYVAFELRDNWVMQTPHLRARIAAANNLQPITLTDDEIDAVVAFLHSLTDPSALERDEMIPMHVPSGLSPQPARER